MRNKRTLQRGLALLLAGGMALSNLGAVPVLAEEYDAAPETVQATPETAAEKVPDGALSEAEAPCLKQTLQKDPPLRRPLPPRKSPFWQTQLPALP